MISNTYYFGKKKLMLSFIISYDIDMVISIKYLISNTDYFEKINAFVYYYS